MHAPILFSSLAEEEYLAWLRAMTRTSFSSAVRRRPLRPPARQQLRLLKPPPAWLGRQVQL
ncbi:unnamed protein product [Symbiodinium necroappetens]|uniref:Uncharacterized protein n=1 Tax=Symbiodinium necroappetens TaxID=1628268 RepID=A0A812UBA0_9DINO|nr:unnamed protein product [Symbiodinium necroappetens]